MTKEERERYVDGVLNALTVAGTSHDTTVTTLHTLGIEEGEIREATARLMHTIIDKAGAKPN